MDSSKFNLWRACFSFCFVDGFLSPEEQAWMDEKLNAIKFTDSEKAILKNDLLSAPNIEGLLPLITNPADRGFLINNIRILAKIDNEVSQAEKEKIEKLLSAMMKKVDLEKVETEVLIDEMSSYHEDEVYKVHNKSSYTEKVMKDLMKKMNPGDYKLP